MIDENFFHNDKFYSELGDLIDDLDLEETINDEADDYVIHCTESELQPMVVLSPSWICERIDDERFPEDDDLIEGQLAKALKVIDYDKVNALIPKLYYERSRKKFTITKQEIINYLK